MNRPRLRFGVLLPHFGSAPTPSGLLDAAVHAEANGFDSVWLRDRLAAGAPHGLVLEAGGTTFYEPLTAAAAIAAVTRKILIGTAVLLPNRHPLRLVQQLGTLSALSSGRLIIGLGLGVGQANFESLGLAYKDRRELFEETVDVLRGATRGGSLTHGGTHFPFAPLKIDPSPLSPLPLYYGGVSRAAVRRAVSHCDGWIAGRLPSATFRERLHLLHRLAGDDRREFDVATMPITLVDSGDAAMRSRATGAVSILARSAEGAGDWIKPPSGHFETVEDLAGLLITGTRNQCLEQAEQIIEGGVSHLIFDLRLAFDDMERQLDLLAGIVEELDRHR